MNYLSFDIANPVSEPSIAAFLVIAVIVFFIIAAVVAASIIVLVVLLKKKRRQVPAAGQGVMPNDPPVT